MFFWGWSSMMSRRACRMLVLGVGFVSWSYRYNFIGCTKAQEFRSRQHNAEGNCEVLSLNLLRVWNNATVVGGFSLLSWVLAQGGHNKNIENFFSWMRKEIWNFCFYCLILMNHTTCYSNKHTFCIMLKLKLVILSPRLTPSKLDFSFSY
jgi:hypothetical protein